MTEAEKQACVSLLRANNVEECEMMNDDDSAVDSLEQLENEVRGAQQRNEVYINCDFIYGSCAEVERLWSLANYILTDERKGNMSPVMFEAILFLKIIVTIIIVNGKNNYEVAQLYCPSPCYRIPA